MGLGVGGIFSIYPQDILVLNMFFRIWGMEGEIGKGGGGMEYSRDEILPVPAEL